MEDFISTASFLNKRKSPEVFLNISSRRRGQKRISPSRRLLSKKISHTRKGKSSSPPRRPLSLRKKRQRNITSTRKRKRRS